jgi:hypothetical protein
MIESFVIVYFSLGCKDIIKRVFFNGTYEQAETHAIENFEKVKNAYYFNVWSYKEYCYKMYKVLI